MARFLHHLCPVTRIAIINGEEHTVTYTTSKVIETDIPTTVYKAVSGANSTVTETDVAYSTLTSVYHVTSIAIAKGMESTVT